MAKKKEKVEPASYLLIRDEHGFKIHHPVHGPCLLKNWDGEIIESLFFEDSIVGEHPARGNIEIWGDGDSVEEIAENLLGDGYTPKEVKKMKLRIEKVATF